MRCPRVMCRGVFHEARLESVAILSWIISTLLPITRIGCLTNLRPDQTAMGQGATVWIASIILLSFSLWGRGSALPHEVLPVPRTTDSLSLTLHVKSSAGEAHFVAVPSSAKAGPTTVTAAAVVNPSSHVALKNAAKNGSFSVRASERSVHIIDGLACGDAYDVFFVIEAVNSNGLFGPVSWVLGVSTNGDAPSITGLSAAPIDAKTNATELSLTMNAPGVSCRVWYTVTPLQNTVLLEVDEISAEEVVAGARPDGVIDLPQGLKGELSPRPVNDGLESDTWYQISTVSERGEGVFSEAVYAIVKTHRESARVMEMAVKPAPGSTTSLELWVTLDCSSAPTSEACGLLSYRVAEPPPSGSPDNYKTRQVAHGTVAVLDGRAMVHGIPGLSPGKAYAVTIAVETPGSSGAFGPDSEAIATTFSVAPSLNLIEISRSEEEPSTITVIYKLSSPGVIHINLSERIGHPLALRAAVVGNQHGVSFSRQVGIKANSGFEEDESPPVLEGSQVLEGLAAGSAFDVIARTESTLLDLSSGVFGAPATLVLEAVPPVLARVQLRPPDAATTELILEYEVRDTAGRMYYVLTEAEAAAKGGKESFITSAEMVKSAVQGHADVVASGSVFVSPDIGGGTRTINSSSGRYDDEPLVQQRRFQGLKPSGRYVVSLCTESNSGSLSEVVVAEEEVHAEAPLVTNATVATADRSAEALSISITLESAGLVHLVVRRAGANSIAKRDHTIVYKGTRKANITLASSNQSPPSAGGRKVPTAEKGSVAIVERVDGLEPNSTYEVFIATETASSNGVYRTNFEPLLATTHPIPPTFYDVLARAADASSSSIVVTVSLAIPAEIHYALFPTTLKDADTKSTGREEPLVKLRDGQGAEEDEGEVHHRTGCANASFSGKGPAVLNETLGIVTSGVVPSVSIDLVHGENSEHVWSVASGAAASGTSTSQRVQAQAMNAWSSSEGGGLQAVFRVEGLEAAKAYDVCLFSETPGSNGLFGNVHEVRGVRTHAPAPELATEKVACTLDCRGLNRDPCWMEANKCGECAQGFVGKAGHVNSPCGKPSALTEADISRIAEREKQEQVERLAASSLSAADVQDPLIERKNRENPTASDHMMSQQHQGQGEKPDVIGDGRLDGQVPPRTLLGVPVNAGPNVTKILYVEVADERTADRNRNGSMAYAEISFDAEAAAAEICADFHEGGGGSSDCLASVSVALASRFSDGQFHREDDPDRPVLQVEIDVAEGDSLAFILRYGDEPGPAMVDFCRENHGVLPDEQACVIMLMNEMGSS